MFWLCFALVINLVISCWNAYATGLVREDAKRIGGFPYVMMWCGRIMAICGFAYCLLIPVSFGAAYLIEGSGKYESLGFTTEHAFAIFELGWLMLIGPIMVTGMIITVAGWIEFYKRPSMLQGGVSAWNTFAMVHNAVTITRHLPGIFGHVTKVFKDQKSPRVLIVIIVASCFLSAILVSLLIERAGARTAARRFEDKYEEAVRKGEIPEDKRFGFGDA